MPAGGDVVHDYGRWLWLQTFSHRRRGTSQAKNTVHKVRTSQLWFKTTVKIDIR